MITKETITRYNADGEVVETTVVEKDDGRLACDYCDRPTAGPGKTLNCEENDANFSIHLGDNMAVTFTVTSFGPKDDDGDWEDNDDDWDAEELGELNEDPDANTEEDDPAEDDHAGDDERVRYTLSPKGCFLAALKYADLIDSYDDAWAEAAWIEFFKMMRRFGYCWDK